MFEHTLDWIDGVVMKDEEVGTWRIWFFDLFSQNFFPINDDRTFWKEFGCLRRGYFKLCKFFLQHFSLKFFRNTDVVEEFLSLCPNLEKNYSYVAIIKFILFIQQFPSDVREWTFHCSSWFQGNFSFSRARSPVRFPLFPSLFSGKISSSRSKGGFWILFCTSSLPCIGTVLRWERAWCQHKFYSRKW